MSSSVWASRTVRQCADLTPYIPGKPVSKLMEELGLAEAIKLASNENPFGAAPKAIAALHQELEQMHRYPDGDAATLRRVIAARCGVEVGQVLVGNGSNEVIELIIRTFAGPGDEVLFAERAFIVYALAARAAGATGVAVAELDGYAPDLATMAAMVSHQSKVLCLANPNNPTGALVKLAEVQRFLDYLPRDLIVLLDEAYFEFVAADVGDSLKELSHPGLVVCRTFSKAYGLAGLRIGYAIASAEIIGLINRFREPFNVNALAQVAATAALEDQHWMQECVRAINQERIRLETELACRDLLAAPCHGNFVLMRCDTPRETVAYMEAQGVIVRPLLPYGMNDLRITVGSQSENDRFLALLPPRNC